MGYFLAQMLSVSGHTDNYRHPSFESMCVKGGVPVLKCTIVMEKDWERDVVVQIPELLKLFEIKNILVHSFLSARIKALQWTSAVYSCRWCLLKGQQWLR